MSGMRWPMNNEEYNDLFYVCALIEYIGRKTKNHRSFVVEKLGIDGIERQLKDAGVNHCLSFEQVSDEIIERYNLEDGDFDTVTNCRYSVPDPVDIEDNRYYTKEMLLQFLSDVTDKIAVLF